MKMMIDAINTVTERTGNIVSGKITPESVLQIWQKMEVALMKMVIQLTIKF